MYKYESMEERERIKKKFVKDYDKINSYKSHYGVIYAISVNGLGIVYIGATSNYGRRVMDYKKLLPENIKKKLDILSMQFIIKVSNYLQLK